MSQIESTIPKVAAIRSETPRPFWSVMIPSYNCPEYIVLTLKSVLAQDPGPAEMEIEVIDDCSPTDILAVLIEAGIDMNRVKFYRHAKGVGMVPNWNSCIERSCGQWVHILHQDDLVLPGFYQTMRANIEKADIGAAFCRVIRIDEQGKHLYTSDLEQEKTGILSKVKWLNRIGVESVIDPCMIIVKRETYEELGGFNSQLISVPDWEMWNRISNNYLVWYEIEPLACYRQSSNNNTSRVLVNGVLAQDFRRAIDIIEKYLPVDLAPQIRQRALDHWGNSFLLVTRQFLDRGEFKPAYINFKEALKFGPSLYLYQRLLRLIPGAIYRQIRRLF